MILDTVAKELRSALEQLRGEHARLTSQISSVETVLAELGAPVRRGPGRPKGSGAKRGPGRPKGSGRQAAAIVVAASAPAKRGPGRPKGSGKKKEVAVAAPAKRGPKAAAAAPAGGGKRRRKPNWSPEAKAQAAERMRAYWAERKKTQQSEQQG